MATSSDLSLLHLLHRAVQNGTDRFARELGGTELTTRQLIVLKAIQDNAGLSQTALVDITGVDRSTLADMVHRLSKHGMVSRKRTKEDARAYAVTLTDAGRRAVATAEPILRAVEKNMLSAIPVKQRSDWLDALRVLVSAD
jgi:MarR family transcriptional regulator, temperature-dependent positive regulator of motility